METEAKSIRFPVQCFTSKTRSPKALMHAQKKPSVLKQLTKLKDDSYDSKDQNQSDSLIIPFKNLINVRYSNLIPRYIGKTKIQMCQFA